MPDVNDMNESFTEKWFTARDDKGENPREEYSAYKEDYSEYRCDVAESPERPLTLYRAEVEWVPHKRIYMCEDGHVEEHRVLPRSTKVGRLQTAVKELLESLNAAEFEIYHQDPYDGGFKPRTIETYGLTDKDMQ